MKRREFIKTAGIIGAISAIPQSLWSSLSGLSDQDIESKIREILPQLSLDEKISLMSGVLQNTLKEALSGGLRKGQGHGYTGYTVGVERLGIPQIKCLDGPRGVGFFYKTTCFPVGMARAATFDPALEEKVGEVMGYETRALGANMLLAPCINLLWHPRWGRAQESYGEDMLLLGAMGSAFVRGVQKHAMACPKHFAVNNIEDTRMDVDALVDERTLREVFLPHFQKCVEVKAASIMSAYNHLNGPKAGQNKHLIREILKQEWGFDGFVVSDWGTAIDNTVEAANAGLDLEMPSAKFYGEKLKSAVSEGKVPVSAIDESVSRMLRQLFRFVGPDFEKGYTQEKIACSEHTSIAREVARKSIVLLKNQGNILPLKGIKSLAVLGKLAMEKNLGDRGSSMVTPPYAVSILNGIKKKATAIKVSYCSGFIPRSKMLAKNADAVVVVAGLSHKDEGEGHDRKRMNLSEDQIELIKTAASVNKKCIVILIGGSAITMQEWIDDVPALLMAWYPGMEGGNAVAEVIFGEVNPSGRLPVVFPKSEDHLFKFENKELKVRFQGFHGYRWFDAKGIEPLFPFGFGLSYTEFKYSNIRLSSKSIGKSGKILVSVDITNIGKVSGEEVAQIYVGYKGSKVERPVKDLKGFQRVYLEPGETKTLSFELKAQELAYYNASASRWDVEEIEYLVYVGPNSKKENLLSDSFKVKGV